MHAARLFLRSIPAIFLLVILGLLPTIPAIHEQATVFSSAGLESSLRDFSQSLADRRPLVFYMGQTPRLLYVEIPRYLLRSAALVLPCVLAAEMIGLVLPLIGYQRHRRFPRPLVALAFLPIFLVGIIGQSAALALNLAVGRPIIGIAYLGGVSFPLLLSVATLLLPLIAYLLRLGDRKVAEISKADYLAAARARGLPERSIAFRHVGAALIHEMAADIPKTAATAIAALIVVERMFVLPGLTRFLIEFPYSQAWHSTPGPASTELYITVVQINVLLAAAVGLLLLYMVTVLVTKGLLRIARWVVE